MNRYAEMALNHWRRHRPRALAAMADQMTHFTRLGEIGRASCRERV